MGRHGVDHKGIYLRAFSVLAIRSLEQPRSSRPPPMPHERTRCPHAGVAAWADISAVGISDLSTSTQARCTQRFDTPLMNDLQRGRPTVVTRSAERVRSLLRAFPLRAMEDAPSPSGLVFTYVLMLVLLVSAAFGSAILVGLSAWAASTCLPSGEPTGSSGSVAAATVALGAVLVAYCLGCAAYLWSIGAAAVHSRVWLAITVVVMGVIGWALTTTAVQPCA